MVFILLLLSILGYGSCLVQLFLRKQTTKQGYRLLYTVGLGAGCVGHLTLIGGLLFGVTRISMGCVLLVGLIGLMYVIIQYFRSHRIRLIIPVTKPDAVVLILGVLLVLGAIYPLFTNALIPPVNYDEIAYHLAIPKLFIHDQSISYISFIPYSNWPMEAEMIFMIGLVFKSELVSHLFTWFCFISVYFGLYYAGNKYFGRVGGMISALLFAGTGMITSIAGTALVEMPLTFFSFFAILAFLQWLEERETQFLALSAIFAGLAASTKLNAAMLPLLLGILVFMLVWNRRNSFKSGLGKFTLYGLIAFAIVSPWYAKTWIQTGNPVWPFLMEVFPTRNWDQTGMNYLINFIQQPNLALTPWNYFKAFWLISARPGEIGPVSYRLGWSYLVLLPVAIIALWKAKRQSFILHWLAALFLIFYTNWFFQTHQARFLMPDVPILALLCGGGVAFVINRLPRWGKITFGLVTFAIIVLNSWMTQSGEATTLSSNWDYVSGKTTREEFLLNRISGMDAFYFANRNLPEDAFVWMALYESRGYYVDRQYEWANPLNQRVIPLEEMASAEELLGVLQNRHFSYIIFRTGQPERYRYISFGDQITDLVYDLLENHAELLYRSYNFGEAVEVYRIIY